MVTETEPVVKGQTTASSDKPARTGIGVRAMVPSHIDAGPGGIINSAKTPRRTRPGLTRLAQPPDSRTKSGRAKAVVQGGTFSGPDTRTRQVCAALPCDRLDVPTSSVRTLGLP